MELADLIRIGEAPVSPFELYTSAVREFEEGHIGVFDVKELYRHALFHAAILESDSSRCPICEADLS